MATMSEGDRLAVRDKYMRENKDPCPFTKADLKASVDYADNWIDTNQADFVSGLPANFGGVNSTTEQKVRLFKFALDRRFETGA